MRNITGLLIALIFITCNSALAVDLSQLKLADGFKISVYASGVVGARSLSLSPSGVLYVGTRSLGFSRDPIGKVYAIRDKDSDGVADEVLTIAEGLDMPNGVAFYEGDLYVAELTRVIKYENIETDLLNPPQPTVIAEGFVDEFRHGWKFIRFSPEGQLYVPVGGPCNICEPEQDAHSNIKRMNPDGTGLEVYAKGVRNSVGFDWHPVTGEFWFTDNGRDMLGDNIPSDELNHAPEPAGHFGFPYCHQGDLLDPEFGKDKNCLDYIAPSVKLGPHVAALGFRFYKGDMLPDRYQNKPIIALHGSWNRTPKAGHTGAKLVVVHTGEGNEIETLVEGWLQENNKYVGRPVDVELAHDGSVFISDDHAGVIYRLSYQR